MPDPTPCAFCGHPDANHRVRDAVVSRFMAGEPIESLLYDYTASIAEVEAWLRDALRQHVQFPSDADDAMATWIAQRLAWEEA